MNFLFLLLAGGIITLIGAIVTMCLVIIVVKAAEEIHYKHIQNEKTHDSK
jgi:hypothetical protein